MTTPNAKRQPIPFGKYLLLDLINIGNMAEVWRAKQFGAAGFERLVAIKRILPDLAEDEGFITMFKDEAKLGVQLTAPNIAQTFEFEQIDNNYYIAMEYISGRDMRALFDRCRKKGEPAPLPLVCFCISKVCEGLDYVHRKKDSLGRNLNIIHRNICPQNVLISYEGDVKVIGIAKPKSRATKTQTMYGNLRGGEFGYMSPEQVRGLPLDRRSDIFAIGVCLYEMLTGERLFVGDSDFSVLENVRKAEVIPPSTYNNRIPESLERIVLKALARDAEDRYQYANELGDDLQRFLITNDSIFGRKDLMQYMKSTFAEYVERERQRLLEYAEVPPPEGMRAALKMSMGGMPAAPQSPPSTTVPGLAPAVPTPPPAPARRPAPSAAQPLITTTAPALRPADKENRAAVMVNRNEYFDGTEPVHQPGNVPRPTEPRLAPQPPPSAMREPAIAPAITKRPIFISYARRTSRKYAEALWRALGGSEVFLDTTDLDLGNSIPDSLVDALLGSRVVVVFADDLYFHRWYCLWELRTALGAYLELRGRAPEAEHKEALQSLVIVWPADGQPKEKERLPPLLRNTNWPKADELPMLVDLVRQRLEAEPRTLGARLDAAGGGGTQERIRKLLLDESVLPPADRLAGFKPLYPLQRPVSLESAFKGRAHDLWKLDFMLSTMRREGVNGAAPSVVLEGGAGFGKTRLALEYLHRLGPKHFPGGIFWVDAETGEERREEQLHGILKTIRPNVPDLVEFKRLKHKVEEKLAEALDERAANAPVLYVVDNVPEPTNGKAQQPLETWCPALGKVSLLVTSRTKLTLGEGGFQALPMDTLEPEAAVALLTHELPGVSIEDTAWTRIAEWVGHLPLALELLNRAIRGGGVTKGELLERLEQGVAQELDRQMEALKPHVAPGSLRGVTEAFSISYERLPEPAKRMARLLAHLAPAPIPLAVLTNLEGEADSDSVRTYLQSRHYVVAHATNKDDVVYFGSMHRLLADWLRGQSSSPLQELSILCSSLARFLSPIVCSNSKKWPLANACLPHAERIFHDLGNHRERDRSQALKEAWLGHSIGILLHINGSLQSASQFQKEALDRLPQITDPEVLSCHLATSRWLALSLYENRHYDEARSLQKQLLKACLIQRGLNHPETLRIKGDIAITLRRLKQPKQARSLQMEVLDAYKDKFGLTHPTTLTAMSQLALTTRALGELEQACGQQRKLLDLCEITLSLENPVRVTAMFDLAVTLNMRGAPLEACDLLEKVLKARQKTYGPQHLRTAPVETMLDNIKKNLTNSKQANAQHKEKTQQTRMHALGPEYWDTLADVAEREEELATSLSALGPEHSDSFAAIPHYEEELESRGPTLNLAHPATHPATVHSTPSVHGLAELGQQPLPQQNEQSPQKSQPTFDPKHLDTLNAMIDSASRLWESGKFSEARSLQEQVLKDFQHNLGSKDPRTLEAKADLALILRALGKMKDARLLQEEVLEAYKYKFGLEHRDTLEAKGNLATTLQSLGDLKQASVLQEEVLNIYKEKLGMEDPLTLAATDYYTATLRELGKLSLARLLGESVLKTRTQTRGSKHPDTLAAKANLARTLRALGAWEHARSYEEEVIKEKENILSLQHPDVLTARANLAETLRDIGQLDRARILESQVLEVRRNTYSVQHPDTLTAMANLASTLRALGRASEAYSLEQEVLERRQYIFGPEHPDTLTAKTNLALTHHALGQLKQACTRQREVREVSENILGSEHPLTLTVMGNLASTLRALGKLEEALSLDEKVLEIRKRIFDPKHPDLLTSMSGIASTLQALGQLEQARLRQQSVLETCWNTIGPKHPRTLTAMFGFASILKGLGELEQARSHAEQALKTMRNVLGDTHPETQALTVFIASLQPTDVWHWMLRTLGR